MHAYLATVAAGKSLTADSLSVAFITWLAHQCPYTEGNAVYQARGLYTMINPDEIYNDDSLCPGQREERMMSAAHDTSGSFNNMNSDYDIQLYPNPAKDYTAVYYDIPVNSQALIQIYDQLGQLVISQVLSATSNKTIISTGQLQGGVYNYRFVLNYQVIKRDKFVVVQ